MYTPLAASHAKRREADQHRQWLNNFEQALVQHKTEGGCMELPVAIRVAVPSDAQALADLHMRSAREGFTDIFPAEQLARSHHQELASDWLARLQPDLPLGQIALVAEVDGIVVGVLLAGPDAPGAAVGRLSRLYVDPRLWGQGVRRRLLNAGVAHLRDIGCMVATAWIMERNHQARALAQHLGWTCTGERQPTCEKSASMPAGVYDVGYQLLLASE